MAGAKKKAPAKRRAKWDEAQFANEVAAMVLAFREEGGLTQTQLGDMIGMKQSAVARLERGDNPPTVGTLVRLSTLKGLSFQLDIIDGTASFVGE